MVSALFLIDNCFRVSLEINYLYLTFKSKKTAVFDVFTVTIGITVVKRKQKMADKATDSFTFSYILCTLTFSFAPPICR